VRCRVIVETLAAWNFFMPSRLAPTLAPAGLVIPAPLIPTAMVPGFIVEPGTNFARESLDVRWLDNSSGGRRNWMVIDAFAFDSQVLQREIQIEAGFVTDFASTPRVLWTLLPPTGAYGKPSVIHDFLYRTVTIDCTRAQADATFLEAMAALNIAWSLRYTMYLGVRLGGRSSFQRRTL
jgi:Protein of unknown function (DUF1353)